MSDDECPVDDTVSWPIIRCEREALRARITELEAILRAFDIKALDLDMGGHHTAYAQRRPRLTPEQWAVLGDNDGE